MKTGPILAASLLTLVVLLGPPGGNATAENDTGAVVLAVDVPGLPDIVALQPADPRTVEAAASAPEAAHGLLAGRFADGTLLHLVHREGISLGLVGTMPPVWVTVADNILMPLPDAPTGDEPIDIEIEAPQGEAPAADGGTQDGKLQFFLVGDVLYGEAWGDLWDDYQLMVIHLMNVLYTTQLGTPIEVVHQQLWQGNDPFQGAEICTGSPTILGSFRNHYESTQPTTGAAHEASHLFTARAFQTSVIGCAYVRQLETAWAYGVSKVAASQLKPINLKRDVNLVSHELGHNFYGLHERAAPTPGGPLNLLGCSGPVTVMYPCLGSANIGVFSDAEALASPLQTIGAVRDGGNVPWMSQYAQERL